MLRDHVVSENGLSVVRVVLGYIARRGRGEAKEVGEVVWEKERRRRWFVVVGDVHHARELHHWRVLLHLDAQDLCLSHRKLHLQLRHLVLQEGDGAHASVDRVTDPCARFVHQAAHRVGPLMNRKLLLFMADQKGNLCYIDIRRNWSKTR